MDRLGLLFRAYQLIDRLSRRREWREGDRDPNQRYSIWRILKQHLALSWMGWTSNLFYEKLRLNPRQVRGMLKLPNSIPSRSQFYKRVRSAAFLKALLGVFNQSAVEVLKKMGSQEVRITMMDLTSVPSTGRDRHATRGTDGKDWFWGYKLGVLCSQSGVVLGVALIKANQVERHTTARMIRMARGPIRTAFGEMPVSYLLCDSGFAGEITHRQSHRYLKCRLVCQPRKEGAQDRLHVRRKERMMRWRSPHRYKDWQFWKTPTAKRIYKKRTDIERRLGQLTDDPFHLDRRPRGTVGVGPVLRWAATALLFWNQALDDNIENSRPLLNVKVHIA